MDGLQWKTLLKLDDLGKPLFSATSIYFCINPFIIGSDLELSPFFVGAHLRGFPFLPPDSRPLQPQIGPLVLEKKFMTGWAPKTYYINMYILYEYFPNNLNPFNFNYTYRFFGPWDRLVPW